MEGVSRGLPTWEGRFEGSFLIGGVGFHTDCQRGKKIYVFWIGLRGGKCFQFWRCVVTTSFCSFGKNVNYALFILLKDIKMILFKI